MAREALLCSECGICEKFACPMMVSPREVNAQIKKALMQTGARWEASGKTPVSHPFRDSRRVPTKRLMQRLDVTRYDTHFDSVSEFSAPRVKIALKQHIGAPAVCVVSLGDRVKKGDLIGEIPENKLGARVHASIDGLVEAIVDGLVTIKAQ
jgi:Na+-translocating ferredoxin:NAD+ oxidoreductase RnfC subunit